MYPTNRLPLKAPDIVIPDAVRPTVAEIMAVVFKIFGLLVAIDVPLTNAEFNPVF